MTVLNAAAGFARTLKPGVSIGGYIIQREIGRGGFGVVYEARHQDPALNWRVAIKELFPQALVIRVNDTVICTNPHVKPVFERIFAKFVETAATLHDLEHANIVRVRDLERAHGTAYMVMDYVEGTTLASWRRGLGRLPTPEEIRAIFDPVFGAIAYMHGKGLLHRDISPANIMVRDGEAGPVLIDFGTVKQYVEQETTKSEHTTSMAVCNRAYAAPEQLVQGSQGHGPFTDVYEAAATLYFALTGKPPAAAELRKNALSIYNRRDPYEPVANVSQTAMPEAVYRAIDKALALIPAERTQTIDAFRADLGWGLVSEKPLKLIQTHASARLGKEPGTIVAIVEGGRPPYDVKALGLPIGLSAAAEGDRIRIYGTTPSSGRFLYGLTVTDSFGRSASCASQTLSISTGRGVLSPILAAVAILVLLAVGMRLLPDAAVGTALSVLRPGMSARPAEGLEAANERAVAAELALAAERATRQRAETRLAASDAQLRTEQQARLDAERRLREAGDNADALKEELRNERNARVLAQNRIRELESLSAVRTPALALPDGDYSGVRGYNRPSEPYCKAQYSFTASIYGGSISFESDDRTWTGTVDQNTGIISIPYSGVSPAPRHPISIQGPYSNAAMNSNYCGAGWFRLTK